MAVKTLCGLKPHRRQIGIRKELHHAESEKAPLDAPYRQSPRARLSDRRWPVGVPQLPREKAPSSLLPEVRRVQRTRGTGHKGNSEVVWASTRCSSTSRLTP